MNQAFTAAFVALQIRYRELKLAGSERGLTTTEVAVLTFVLVAAAAAIGLALYNYSNDQVQNLPENPAPNIGGGNG
jgi:hypothetical protein